MLVFKNEYFGGIVFNTNNAAQLSLDKKGFFIFKKYALNREINLCAKEKRFINKVLNLLGADSKFETKIIKNKRCKNTGYFFEVLSSPTLADIQITTRCNLICPHCYANSRSDGRHISWRNLLFALDIFEQAGVFQIALGGGEPTLHPKFVEIIKETRRRGMVPNLTTNGKELTYKIAESMGKYCGAVALSVEGIGKEFEKRRNFSWKKLHQSAKLLKQCGNKLVFQITVSDSNIKKLPDITRRLLNFNPYGLIFLAYKPVGRGKFFDRTLVNRKNNFIKSILKKCMRLSKNKTRIGFDCCFAQGIVEMAKEHYPFDFEVVEGCSALRNSLAINRNLDIIPCSFIDQKIGNLKEESLSSIWLGKKAEEFRKKFYGNVKNPICANCQLKKQCLGGCPEFELVRCSKMMFGKPS